MEKVFLVFPYKKSLSLQDREERLNEMMELIRSAGGQCVGYASFAIDKPSASTYVKQGNLMNVTAQIKEKQATISVFGVDLNPGQARNLEDAFDGTRIVDRTGLILDIFSRRAVSKEGKLQVELAQLNYLLPRLVGRGVIMSRLGGGIGTRGPGEQKLEVDRRKIRDRISHLKKDLKKLRVHRTLLRNNRKKNNVFVVSLVGYTNAGKSTLMNQLTGADVKTEDKLFATLDPVTRKIKARNEKIIVFTDTVGFLIDLPHKLIESFQATLEEINDSDLILHVLDSSNKDIGLYQEVTESVLKDLGCEKIPCWHIYNKRDLVPELLKDHQYTSESFLVSALNGDGVDDLKQKISEFVERKNEN